MHFYLSSYQLCNHPSRFSSKFKGKRKVAIIKNALDFNDDIEWQSKKLDQQILNLKSLGLDGQIVDLRDFFDRRVDLRENLSNYGGFWVVGGNAFVLRKAMQQSGFDEFLLSSLASDLVYGGYSAGVCVLSPFLHGIHLVDKPDILPAGYRGEPVWDGLNILKYSVAPHYASQHHESHLIEHAVRYFIENKILFVALKDGESISCEILSV
jgi:dipeptidase E